MTVSETPDFRALVTSAEKMVGSLVHLGEKVVGESLNAAGPASERVARELRQARAVGQFTVLTATAKLKQQFASPAPTVVTSDTTEETTTTVVPPTPGAIPDYKNLSASQIIPLLDGLTETERNDIAAYESATRGRKTILAALRSPIE